MTNSVDSHEPSPEFRAHLQWQIETALRRESRLASPVSGGIGRLRRAMVVLVALAIGGAGGVVSGHVQDAQQRKGLIESLQAEMALTKTRLELAQAEYRDAQERYDVGLAGRESVRSAEQQLRTMEAALARLQLDLEEIEATSAPARNELDAPLVDGRDFVRDRVHLELERAQRKMVAAEEIVAQLQERVEVGTASRAALTEAEADVARVQSEMALLRSKLDLRRRYLQKEIAQEEVASALRRTELTLALQRAQQVIVLARERLTQLRRQAAVGLAAELEVKRAEVDLLEREIEVQSIRRELAALSSRVK